MAFRETSPSLVNRLNQLSVEGKSSRMPLKPKVPALKAAYRKENTSAKSPESGVRDSPPTRTKLSAAPRPQARNVQTSLTPKWFDNIDHANQNPPPGIDSPNQNKGLELVSEKTTHSPSTRQLFNSNITIEEERIGESLIPSFLRDDQDINSDRIDDEEPELQDDLVTQNPWAVRNPFLPATNPPGPPRLIGKTPSGLFTLEPLGPLRSSQSRQAKVVHDFIPEPPRIPYAAVARKGLPKIQDLPKVISSLGPSPSNFQEDFTEDLPNYTKLIREAVHNHNPRLAEEYLQGMIVDFYSGIGSEPPDGRCYNLVLHAYAVQGDPIKTEAILKLMWEDYERGNKCALPNKRCYTSCMYAWQKSTNKIRAPVACEEILREMYKLHDSGVATGCKPDLFAYTCILHCWADSNRKDAVACAEALFQNMLTRVERGEKFLRPDNVCYSNLINVYILAGPKDFDTIEKAEIKFRDMVKSFFDGNETAAPTTRNFNTILAAFSKLPAPQAAEHAELIVTEWEEYNSLGQVHSKPDAYSYSLLLKSWAISHHPDAVRRLLAVVRHLEILADSNNKAARFDTIKYTTVIGALCKHDKSEDAHDFLLEMISAYQDERREDSKPELRTFHGVLSSWTRHQSAPVLAANKAEDLMTRLWNLHQCNKKMKPTTETYNMVLKCCQQAKQAWRANAFLDEMKRLSNQKAFASLGPNKTSYRTVLETWEATNDAAKYSQIRVLSKEFKDRFNQVYVSDN